jgi:fructan beta-fructosidase
MPEDSVYPGRPVCHFTPQRGWINDPNGLVFAFGQYHLFAQHNPADTSWGPMHWLHAVSRDLVHWRELGIALYPDASGMKFSGSAVLDAGNTSGLGEREQPPLVLIYTRHGQTEEQALSFSLDGQVFHDFPENPVIANPGFPDFRDPKIFRTMRDPDWHLVLTAGKSLLFYASRDLRSWRPTGEFSLSALAAEPAADFVLECPDCFDLTAPDGQLVSVLLYSEMELSGSRRSQARYWLGHFDGSTFQPMVQEAGPFCLDPGPDHYAPVSFFGLPDVITMGWGCNWSYRDTLPRRNYCGQMTLARRLTLGKTAAGLRLQAEPVLPRGLLPADPAAAPGLLDLCLNYQGPFSCTLFNDAGESWQIRLEPDAPGEVFILDRSHCTRQLFFPAGDPDCYAKIRTPRLVRGPGQLRILYDQTSVEVFADQGLLACHLLVMPLEPYDRIELSGQVSRA